MGTLTLKEKIALKRKKISEKSAGYQREYRFKPGKTYFRLLPGKVSPSDFYEEMGQHWIKDASGQVVAAPGDRQICYGEICPVRSAIEEYIRHGQAVEDDAVVKRGKDMLAKSRYKANIAVIKAPGDYTEGKPELADFPESVWDSILSQLEDMLEDMDSDADVTKEGPFSYANGVVFVLEKSGSGLDTKYNVYQSSKVAPVKPEIMEQATDLGVYKRAQFDESVRKGLAYLGNELGIDLSSGIVIEGEAEEVSALTHATEDSGEMVIEGEAETVTEPETVGEVEEDDVLAALENL